MAVTVKERRILPFSEQAAQYRRKEIPTRNGPVGSLERLLFCRFTLTFILSINIQSPLNIN